MGETRDPDRSHWVVFEGDGPVTSLEDALRFGESINRDITWPVTLRVHRIKDRVMESRDIEIDEALNATVKAIDRVNLDTI